MTERDRLLKVLKKEIPDRVPWFADLGHWYRAQSDKPWDLFAISNRTQGMIDLHKEVKAGWYIEVGALHREVYVDGVRRERGLSGDMAIEMFITPLGEIRMERKWNPISYSWDIVKLMVESVKDLEILTYAMERKHFIPEYENWNLIEQAAGDIGLGFPSMGYTGFGSLISYYMGIQNTVYAVYDYPEAVKKYVDICNRKHLELTDLYCKSQAPHIFFGDNLSGDVQSPELFLKYSFNHYKEIARRLHAYGKTVSAHCDGRLNNIMNLIAKTGVDVADACTPAPGGDLTPCEMRHQAGNELVLFGGVSPNMWLPQTKERDFIEHVKKWLELRKVSPRLVQSAGDQVPPGTELKRIKLMADIVEEYGRYPAT